MCPQEKSDRGQVSAYELECGFDNGDGNKLPVLPMLMPEYWERKPTQLGGPLISGVQLPGVPWVAMAHLIGEDGINAPQRAYLRSERAEQIGKTAADFKSEAIYNISARPASWNVLDQKDGGRIAICTDDYLAAEHCLSRAFMREASRLLGDNELVVGIPSRGSLFAVPSKHFATGDDVAYAYMKMVKQCYDKNVDIRITPGHFLFIDGAINSMLEIS